MREIDPDLIRREAAADMLKISTRHLDRLASLGKVPQPFRYGPNCILYSRREISEWLESQRKAG